MGRLSDNCWTWRAFADSAIATDAHKVNPEEVYSCEKDGGSEDCLYLNVWVPQTASSSSALPVKVWIYGGAETSGTISDPLYNGCNLAGAGAIVVSINYRLGPLGFLALDSAGIEGNFAISDLLLGLEWVQSNIAAFGGDPQKVLLFGQSAGAANTYTLAGLPQAPLLFRAAISESGGGRDLYSKAKANSIGQAFAKKLGCSTTNASCLRSASTFALNASFAPIPDDPAELAGFAPVVDGKVIPSNGASRVPIIFGTNNQGGTFSVLPEFIHPSAVTTSVYNNFLISSFGPAAHKVAKQYPISAFKSTPFPSFYAMAKVYTDAAYKCPAYKGLNAAINAGIPAWTYLFDHNDSCMWLPEISQQALNLLGASLEEVMSLLGPTHTAEIPFTFGNTANLPFPNGTCNFTSSETQISQSLVAAWSSMADSRQPSVQDGGLQWPAYSPSSSQGIIISNSTATVGHIDYTACELLNPILAGLLKNIPATNSSTTPTATASALSSSTGNGSRYGVEGNNTVTVVPTPTPLSFTGAATARAANLFAIVAGALALLLRIS